MLLSSEIVKLFCQATSSSGTLTKPGTLSVNDFRRDFIATLFPDANGGTGLSDEEIKHAFFGAMPKSWHTSFEGAGYHEHTSTVENIADYMKIMEQQHPFEARLARTTTSNAGTVLVLPKSYGFMISSTTHNSQHHTTHIPLLNQPKSEVGFRN